MCKIAALFALLVVLVPGRAAWAWPTLLARHGGGLSGVEVIGDDVRVNGELAGTCDIEGGIATVSVDAGDWQATWRLRPGDYAVTTASDGVSVHLGEWNDVVSLRLEERAAACAFVLLGLGCFWFLLVCMWRRAVTP